MFIVIIKGFPYCLSSLSLTVFNNFAICLCVRHFVPLFLKRSARLHLTLCLSPAGRVRTRRQSSGSTVSSSSTVTDSRGRSRAKVVSQSQRKCLCGTICLVLIHLHLFLLQKKNFVTEKRYINKLCRYLLCKCLLYLIIYDNLDFANNLCRITEKYHWEYFCVIK